MFKVLLVIAVVAFGLCQAMPANLSQDTQQEFGCGGTDGRKCLNGRVTLPVERSWIETTNQTVMPILSLKREIIRDMVHLSNESVSLDQWSNDFAKRIVDSLTAEEKRRFVEPLQEFIEKRNQFTREFAEFQDDQEFAVRGLDWTQQVRRAWKETNNGSVVPIKRDEWIQLLNDSVVAPVTRDVEEQSAEKRKFELDSQDSENKREFDLNQIVSSPQNQGLFSREFNDLATKNAINFIRQSRSLSDYDFQQGDSQYSKLCDGSQGFKYYQSHPTNESLYIQCDPWGQAIVKECEWGLVWNQWKLNCSTVEEVRNASSSVIDGSEFDLISVVQALFDCNQPQYACVNGGVCTKLSAGYKCVCSGNFTGDLCEVKIDSTSIYSEILSGQFPFESYKKSLANEVQIDEQKYFEQFKDTISPDTYDHLMKYVQSYQQGQVRYDRLVSCLIEDLLQDIYPDAFYLSVFNASQESVGNVVRMVPNLKSYWQYSNERYVQVFYQYQKSLQQLIPLLNSSWPTVKEEATEYYKLFSQFLNSSLLLNSSSVYDEKWNATQYYTSGQDYNSTYGIQGSSFSFGSRPSEVSRKNGLGGGSGPINQWSESDVMGKMKSEYNETQQATQVFFDVLEKFRTKALVAIKHDQRVVNQPLCEVNFDYVKDTIERLDEVSKSSTEIWASLVNYGFWYLTNTFSEQRI